jgi:hypothetical protein
LFTQSASTPLAPRKRVSSKRAVLWLDDARGSAVSSDQQHMVHAVIQTLQQDSLSGARLQFGTSWLQ